MKLSHCEFRTVFELSPDRVNVLVIEKEEQFYRYVEELALGIQADEGRFCLFEGETLTKLGKCSVIVTDVLQIQSEGKKVLTKFLSKLKEMAETEYLRQVSEIREKIFPYLLC